MFHSSDVKTLEHSVMFRKYAYIDDYIDVIVTCVAPNHSN